MSRALTIGLSSALAGLLAIVASARTQAQAGPKAAVAAVGASKLRFGALPDSIAARQELEVRVSALTASGAVDTSYSDSATLTSSDSLASLPRRVAFTNGQATFSVVFKTTGHQSLDIRSDGAAPLEWEAHLTVAAKKRCVDRATYLCSHIILAAVKTIAGQPVHDEFFDLNFLFSFGSLFGSKWIAYMQASTDLPLSTANASSTTNGKTDTSETLTDLTVAFNVGVPAPACDTVQCERRLGIGILAREVDGGFLYGPTLSGVELSGSVLQGSFARLGLLWWQMRPDPTQTAANLYGEFLLRASENSDVPVLRFVNARVAVLIPLSRDPSKKIITRIVLAVPLGDLFSIVRGH